IKYILGSNGHIFFQVVGYASGNYKISLKNWKLDMQIIKGHTLLSDFYDQLSFAQRWTNTYRCCNVEPL
ncbi:hypothetical protein S83_061599, partial [Arachis hypogaea]